MPPFETEPPRQPRVCGAAANHKLYLALVPGSRGTKGYGAGVSGEGVVVSPGAESWDRAAKLSSLCGSSATSPGR